MTVAIIMTHYSTASLICCFRIPTAHGVDFIFQGDTFWLCCVVYLMLNYFLSLIWPRREHTLSNHGN